VPAIASDGRRLYDCCEKGVSMPRTPNYNFERKERDRLKAAKKAEKLALKAAKKPVEVTEEADNETEQK
jgi:hypothetical protein